MNRRNFLSVIPLLVVGPSEPIRKVTYSFLSSYDPWQRRRAAVWLVMNSLYGKDGRVRKSMTYPELIVALEKQRVAWIG